MESMVLEENRNLNKFSLGKLDLVLVGWERGCGREGFTKECDVISACVLCLDNPDTGPPALASFIIIALCPLSRRWLFMEQTARGE